jgi:hypothetical protein
MTRSLRPIRRFPQCRYSSRAQEALPANFGLQQTWRSLRSHHAAETWYVRQTGIDGPALHCGQWVRRVLAAVVEPNVSRPLITESQLAPGIGHGAQRSASGLEPPPRMPEVCMKRCYHSHWKPRGHGQPESLRRDLRGQLSSRAG